MDVQSERWSDIYNYFLNVLEKYKLEENDNKKNDDDKLISSQQLMGSYIGNQFSRIAWSVNQHQKTWMVVMMEFKWCGGDNLGKD